MKSLRMMACAVLALGIGSAAEVQAMEYPIGEAVIAAGMELAAVYLQPVDMSPPGTMREAAQSDIHLEADIHAAAGNPDGFAEGDWLPYLVLHYELTKLDSGEQLKGELMPMVASDGPHYGDNVKLAGMGNYRLVLTVVPPSANAHADFGRHTDRETGVAPWFEPFTVEYVFTFAGTGKKGGY